MALTVIDFSQSYATWVAGDGADLAGADMAAGTTSPRPWTWANLVESYILAAYPFHRGAALSVWARASNTEGALTNVAAATTGHVFRRSGTALAFGTLEAGAFATGPGIVTFAMMDNAAARTVAGRSANSSGVRADIAGAGTAAVPQVLSDNGTTLAFRSQAEVNTLYEVNYSTLANNTLADGAEVIDGLNYVAANMAELGTAAVQNGTGIRMIVATSNGTASAFDSTSQPAAHIYVPLSQISGYDPTADYLIEVYMPSLVLETNGENVFLGLWGVAGAPFAASVARARLVKIHNSAGTRVLRSVLNATATDGDVAIPTHNVMAIKVSPQGLGQVYSGVWSAGWPTTYTAGPMFPTAAAAASPLNTGDMRLVLGIGTANDASPTTAVTFERLRIRKVG
jgi:hypothetical protein